MPPSPYVVAALVAVSGASFALHMAGAPEPFAASAAAVLAIGAVIFSTIAVTGLVLVRGRWSRYLGVIVASSELAVVAVTDASTWAPWGWITLAVGLVALGGLLGRWLDGWVRARPSATGPDPTAVLVLLGLIGLVPLVGMASPDGLETAHGVLGAAGVLLAWAYGKAQTWAVWAIRLVLPIVAIPALIASPWFGAVMLGAWVVGLTILAWRREVLLATQPLMDDLPGPRHPRPSSAEEPS